MTTKAATMAQPEPEAMACFENLADYKNDQTLRIVAVFVILVASMAGVLLPLLNKHVAFLRAGGAPFQWFRSLGTGVIVTTGFVHMIPDAFTALTNPCLGWPPNYPWAGFIACFTALLVILLEGVIGHVARRRAIKLIAADSTAKALKKSDIEMCPDCDGSAGHEAAVVHAPKDTLEGNGKLAGLNAEGGLEDRMTVIAQVLEAGIAFHSVLIGLGLGVAQATSTARGLLIALIFHQFFEGFALGSCLVAAQYKRWGYAGMAAVFALTTPLGIALGLGIASTYQENSVPALATEGTFDAASAGILIYTGLVDLVAEDMRSPRLQSSWRLQTMAYIALLLGAACMSVLAIWA